MSNLFEDTPIKELLWLLRQIQEREVGLPDFQRDFVWEPGATQELIVSIVSNYPAGSLLAIRNTHTYFAAREFEGAPPLNGCKPTYLILDGQQRLTSLFQAFFGVGEYRYFINLKPLVNGADIDDENVLFHVRSNAQRGWPGKVLKKYATLEGQAEDLVLPLQVLSAAKNSFYRWLDSVSDMVDDKEARAVLKESLRKVQERIIDNIEGYKFPMVLLSDETPPDAVCTIFETLNRTGVKLSVFDLLVARLWPEKVKLREMWESAIQTNPIIKDFQIDPYYVLQIIALLRTEASPSCKRKDVLKLTATQVADTWNKAIEGLVTSLTTLQDDCGVVTPQWLPYTTILVPFGALLAKYPAKGLTFGETKQKLKCWFWCSVFGQTYENAPNSQSAKDLQEVGGWLAGGEPPRHIAEFSFDSSALFEVTPKQRALYRGVIALVLSNNPRDFHEVKPMTRKVIEEQNVDDHHIFPDAYLKELGFTDSKRRDCILNRTLIDRATNQSLSCRDPQSYFGEMRKRLGQSEFTKLLESHFLPAADDSPLLQNDYERFLVCRSERIGQALTEATHKPCSDKLSNDVLKRRDETLTAQNDAFLEREAAGLGESQGVVSSVGSENGIVEEQSDENLAMSENDVLVVPAQNAWPEYNEYFAYVCQADRSFRPVKWLAFYSDGQIYPLVPMIHELHDHVEFAGQHEGRLGELVELLRKTNKWKKERAYKVVLLSPPQSSDTLNLGHSIPNDCKSKAGKPTAFVQNQRYVSSERLKTAKTTSDLVATSNAVKEQDHDHEPDPAGGSKGDDPRSDPQKPAVQQAELSTFARIATDIICNKGGCEILRTYPKHVNFIPVSWAKVVPENGTAWKHLSRPVSVICWLELDDNTLSLKCEVSRMDDPKLRLACVKGLRDAGFSPYSKAFRDDATFSRFYRESRKLQDSANEEEMRAGIEELFGKAKEEFPKAEAVFQRVFAEKHTGTIADHQQQKKPLTFNEIVNEYEECEIDPEEIKVFIELFGQVGNACDCYCDKCGDITPGTPFNKEDHCGSCTIYEHGDECECDACEYNRYGLIEKMRKDTIAACCYARFEELSKADKTPEVIQEMDEIESYLSNH